MTAPTSSFYSSLSQIGELFLVIFDPISRRKLQFAHSGCWVFFWNWKSRLLQALLCIWPKAYRVINVICSFLSSQNSGYKRPIFTYLGDVGKALACRWWSAIKALKKNCGQRKLQETLLKRAYHPIFFIVSCS
jgi:hypothetical protein